MRLPIVAALALAAGLAAVPALARTSSPVGKVHTATRSTNSRSVRVASSHHTLAVQNHSPSCRIAPHPPFDPAFAPGEDWCGRADGHHFGPG